VAARGGNVIELRGDEALAVFTSARQALRAAVELQDRFAEESAADPELPLAVGIGLDAGEAVQVEGGYRGGALNLGARLCSLAGPGEVLVSAGVIHLARKVEGLAYAERGMVELKGFAEPVKVVAVGPLTPDPYSSRGEGSFSPAEQESVSPSPAPRERGLGGEGTQVQHLPIGGFLGSLPSSALVARDAEMGSILASVDAVADGKGRVVMLAGEPGIGKTRLAQEVTRLAHGRDFLIATGRCYEQQQSVAYYPFLEALATAYSAAPARVRSQATHRWPYLGRLLPDLLGSATPAFSDSQEEQLRLFRAVTGFLQAIAAEVPLALLLDDLHWADGASLDLLQHLARNTHGNRILVLGTYRDVDVSADHPLEAALRDLGREQLLERVPVRRLGEDGTAALIAEIVGEIQAGTEFANLLHRRTDGNPYFTQQVLRVLIDNGSVYRQDGHWERRAVEEIDVPESVRSVIGQRVSRLSEDTQEILREASVLGQSFNFDDLLAMKSPDGTTPQVEDEVDVALTEATAMGLVRTSGKEDYSFDHALTQQALYAALSPRRRRRLHLAAGEALERLPERKRAQRVAELAWQFHQGDDPEKALSYSILAGDQAEEVFAHGEAERHYREALDLAREIEDRAQEAGVLERLGSVLRLQGRSAQALETLDLAARLDREAGDLEAEGRATAQIGVICSLGHVPEDGIRRIQPLVEALERRGPSHALALLYAALVRLYNRTGNQDGQLTATRRLLELARTLGDERLLAEAELHHGNSLMHLGQYREAVAVLEDSIRRSEHVGDLSTLCAALDHSSRVHHSLRQMDRMMRDRERSFQVAEQLGDPREASFRAVEVSYVAFLLGNWTQARAYAERSLNYALSLDELRVYLQPLYALAELCLYEGEWEDAFGYLKEYSAIAEHIGAVEALREAQGLLAEADILNGDPEAALARLQPFLDRPGWEDHLSFLLPLAWTYLENERVSEAQDAAAKALTEATRQRASVGTIEALRVHGMIASRQGFWQEAESRFQEGLRLAREILYPWGEARACYGLGLMHERRGEAEPARAYLEEARVLFERLNAKLYQARVDTALQRL
jgi:tetratricopeptide (TPR) repeat protein